MALEPKFRGTNERTAESDAAVAADKESFLNNAEPYLVEGSKYEGYADNVDFGVMRSLLEKDFTKSGGKSMNFADREDVIFHSRAGAIPMGMGPSGALANMSTLPKQGLICVNVDTLSESMREAPEADPEVVFVKLLFHEEGHMGHHVSQDSDNKVRMGVQVTGKTFENLGILNEGLNEWGARQNTLEYYDQLKRPLKPFDKQWLTDIYSIPQGDIAQIVPLHLFSEICLKISKDQGYVSFEDVARSFVQAAYSGLDMMDTATRQYMNLDSVFGKRFTIRLGELNSLDINAVIEFMDEYKLTQNDAKFFKVVNHVKATRQFR